MASDSPQEAGVGRRDTDNGLPSHWKALPAYPRALTGPRDNARGEAGQGTNRLGLILCS